MRALSHRLNQHGYSGLWNYRDLNVQYFHDKLREAHGIQMSYSWVRTALRTELTLLYRMT